MNIAIMMSVWCHNLWDELILKNEIQLLKETYWHNTNFKIFTYDLNHIFYTNDRIQYIEYFPIWIKNPQNIVRNIKNYFLFVQTIFWANKVVIWWGWIMFDNESWNYSNPLNQWIFRTSFIKMMKKDIIFYWVSIDIKTEENLKKIKKIFSTGKEIYVRDKASFELLQDLWVKSEIILDPVFHDNGSIGWVNYKKNFLIKKIDAQKFCLKDLENIDFHKKIVWFALRSSYLNNEYQLINEIIDFILKNWWTIILLPHSFHQTDDTVNDLKFLTQFIKPWVHITSSLDETYQIYKQKKIHFCLSMRLHSMILSQIYAIDFIGIKYAQKWDIM